MEMIKVEDLSFWYPENKEASLKDINITIKEGEFILVVGASGSGKSTLIRLFNRIVPDFYGGRIKGNVYLKGKDIRKLEKRDIVNNIGMVYQHPEKQIVLQDVEREIAFGLENLNTELNKMKRNVCEAISFLNLSEVRDKVTTEISGGQKQRVAIASVVAMDPEIILFDEPISQLDPIAAEEVLNSIKRLNRDMGKTVVLVEQRLDKCFDMADRIIFMENGRIVGEGNRENIPDNIDKKYFLPSISYIFKQAGRKVIPVNVKEARDILKDSEFKCMDYRSKKFKENIIEAKKVEFEYKKGLKTLKDVNFSLSKGEVMAVMGENGAGKSTLFKIVAGLIDKYKGEVRIKGKNLKKFNKKERIKTVGYLSQNPNDYLGRETVFDEVAYTLRNINEYDKDKVNDIIKKLEIDHLKNRNPRDLSGGEKQRVAIASTMVTDPEILILDEPTRGMDALSKEKLGRIIQELSKNGKSVIIVSHDADFVADFADSVMLMFNGEVVARGSVYDMLYDSIYYSPQIAKVFKNKCRVVKSNDAIELLRVM